MVDENDEVVEESSELTTEPQDGSGDLDALPEGDFQGYSSDDTEVEEGEDG